MMEETYYDIIPVAKGTRFANYLIDLIFFYLVIILGGSFWAILISTFNGSTVEATVSGLENLPPIVDRLFTLILYGVFMTIQEVIFGGRSIGKFITGTKVVTTDGYQPDIETLVKRNLFRAVPFDQISFLGIVGWHDKWSDTTVVKK